MRRILRGKRGIVVAVLAGIILIGLLGHRAVQATCGFDPTDDCNWSVIVVRNDAKSPVELRACVHHCGQGDRRLDPVEVEVDEASPAQQYGGVYANTGGLNWSEVTDRATGRRLGCLVLRGHSNKTDGDVVLVSQARPCSVKQPPATPVGHASVQSVQSP
jgi:hypothetical protein